MREKKEMEGVTWLTKHEKACIDSWNVTGHRKPYGRMQSIKKAAGDRTQTQSETETQKETESETQSETETETELQTDIAYTSQDKSVQITLPDSTWKVTQDADEQCGYSLPDLLR